MSEKEINNENNAEIKNTIDDYKGMESNLNFKYHINPDKQKNQNQSKNNNVQNVDKPDNIDNTITVLNNEEDKNSTINNLNVSNKNNDEKNTEKKGFFQNAKSWIGKTWQNIKNYDYSKLNIFKQEEMEEILDAHGFPMKVPKRKNKTNPEKTDK